MRTATGFYAYRLPGEKTVHAATGCTATTVEDLRDLQGRDVFIISEFNGRIHALHSSAETVTPLSGLPSLSVPKNLRAVPSPTPREVYMKGAESIIHALLPYSGRKVVYSRIVVEERWFRNAGEFFTALCGCYPDAYVFCYHTPHTGLWIGASPELLAEYDGTTVRSMALAGTKHIEDTSPWDRKNIEEHAFVTRFIAQRFTYLGIRASRSRTATLEAGPVKHMCTRFASTAPVTPAQALQLPRTLSPTPALCGTPRPYARRMINTYEHHHRACYGGFLGPMTARGNYVFWVNLRCMQADNTRVALYVGGGLTRMSDPADEWIETSTKALTLLSL